MEPTKQPTEFAPAERASPADIAEQSLYFQGTPLLGLMIDAIPDIFVILNKERQIVFANNALLEMMELTDVELVVGLRLGEALDCVRATETEGGCGTTEFCRTCGALQAILSSLRGEKAIQECRIMRKDGSALDLLVWATPFTIGEERFSLFAVQDISHEKRRRALERIFFHDILNTAGGVMGFADLLRGAEPEDLDLLKEQVYILSQRLIAEINTQRELMEAENNELAVHLTPLESLHLLDEIVTLYRNHSVARDRHLKVASEAQAFTLVSDGVLLSRVLGNMVKNALEASEPGATVTLSCRRRDDSAEFSVHNPAFIPRDVQLQVFQRSFSTKGYGRGLGTYSMKLLSERYLKGRVTFTSTWEQGTIFTARYPLMLGA